MYMSVEEKQAKVRIANKEYNFSLINENIIEAIFRNMLLVYVASQQLKQFEL